MVWSVWWGVSTLAAVNQAATIGFFLAVWYIETKQATTLKPGVVVHAYNPAPERQRQEATTVSPVSE